MTAPGIGTPLRTVVVDDEERARRRLCRMLAAEPLATVVAEAQSGAEAVTAITRHSPDLVFLDVQMPDLDGFGVLAQLPRPPRYVVFTTAYDRYALDAFSVGALDYLLKPFGEDRKSVV
jgi:two-component system LytT family response regulator